MKSDSGSTDSVWMATAEVPSYPALAESLHTNVCIVGAGIAGLTTAYLLAREGKSVVLVDDGPIAGGETGRTTAHLAYALDDRYSEIERMHGRKGARLAAESHVAAIDQIEQIVREEGIDCDFLRLDGYLFNTPGAEIVNLEEELQACQNAGLAQVRMVERAPIPNYNTGPALLFPNHAQFHPVKYAAGLAKAIEKLGGRIFTRTHVDSIKGGAEPCAIAHGGHKITANAVVVATNTPIVDWVAVHTKQAAYRTYVIGALIPKGALPPLLIWDTPDPYHYVRTQPQSERHDLLIIGGEDHKTGQAEDTEARFDRLESWGRQIFPFIDFIEYRWSGQIMEPADAMAFIGPDPGGEDNVYVATGDSGNGMTHGTIAGMLISDLLDGRDNEWAKLYDPKRKPLRALGEYAKENINVAVQYADYLKGGDMADSGAVPPGEGAVIRRGVQKIAVYRDNNGETHEFSAVCPHLGCIVDWNQTEKSWDCPCHGSRFSALGKVVNGPANSDLTPAEDDEPEDTAPVHAAQ